MTFLQSSDGLDGHLKISTFDKFTTKTEPEIDILTHLAVYSSRRMQPHMMPLDLLPNLEICSDENTFTGHPTQNNTSVVEVDSETERTADSSNNNNSNQDSDIGASETQGTNDSTDPEQNCSDEPTKKQNPVDRLTSLTTADIEKLSEAERIELFQSLSQDDLRKLDSKGAGNLYQVLNGLSVEARVNLINTMNTTTIDSIPSNSRAALLNSITTAQFRLLPLDKRLAFADRNVPMSEKLAIINELEPGEISKLSPQKRTDLLVGAQQNQVAELLRIPIEKRLALMDGLSFQQYKVLVENENMRRAIPVSKHIEILNKATPEEIRSLSSRTALVESILKPDDISKGKEKLNSKARIALFTSISSDKLKKLDVDLIRAYTAELSAAESLSLIEEARLDVLELIPPDRRIELLKSLSAEQIRNLNKTRRLNIMINGASDIQTKDLLEAWGTPEKVAAVPERLVSELLKNAGDHLATLSDKAKQAWAPRVTPALVRAIPASAAILNWNNPPGSNGGDGPSKGGNPPGNGGDKPSPGGPGTGGGDGPKGPGTGSGDKPATGTDVDKTGTQTDTNSKYTELAQELLKDADISAESISKMSPDQLKNQLRTAAQKGMGIPGTDVVRLKAFIGFLDKATGADLELLRSNLTTAATQTPKVAGGETPVLDPKTWGTDPKANGPKAPPINPTSTGVPTTFDTVPKTGVDAKPAEKPGAVGEKPTGKTGPIKPAPSTVKGKETVGRVAGLGLLLSAGFGLLYKDR